ncbi:MAG: hypothetical protein L6R48_19380 [Planctomycetes bacterium]|nr:hypothetical protein [Planctomycetota bacterium]
MATRRFPGGNARGEPQYDLGVSRRIGSGAVHDWCSDLVAAATDHAQLIGTRSGTGVFWGNCAPRWGETIPELATSYVVHTLALVAEG